MKLLDKFSRKDLRSATVGSMSIKLGSTALTFLNSILLARLMTVEKFGTYILIYSIIIMLSIPISLGLPALITRYIPKYEIIGSNALIRGLLIRTNQFGFLMLIVIYLLALLTYYLWWNMYDDEIINSVIIGLLLVPVLGFGALRNGALRGMKLVILSDLPDTLIRNLLLTIMILGVAFLTDHNLTVEVVMWMNVVAGVVALVLGYYFLWKQLLVKIRKVVPEYQTKLWLKESLPFSVNKGVQIIKQRIITYLLGIFGSFEAIAFFEVASKGVSLVSFFLDSLNLAIAPFVSGMYEKGEMDKLRSMIKKNSRLILLCALPVALLFILGGEWVIELVFGIEYIEAYAPLVILCIAQLISSMVGSVGLLLNMTGYQRILMNSNVLALLLMTAISIPLILGYDVFGAAVAYAVALVLQNLYLLYYSVKKLNVNTTVF